MTRAFEDQLQAHLLLMAGEAPIPLAGIQSRGQGLRLRRAGLTYGSIATVMSIYHGDTRTENAWRNYLRSAGAAPKHFKETTRVAPRRTP